MPIPDVLEAFSAAEISGIVLFMQHQVAPVESFLGFLANYKAVLQHNPTLMIIAAPDNKYLIIKSEGGLLSISEKIGHIKLY